jgi:hypothetical protein
MDDNAARETHILLASRRLGGSAARRLGGSVPAQRLGDLLCFGLPESDD